MEFDKCIQLIKEASQLQGIEPSADMVLDCATRVFNATRIETAKAEVNGNAPASDKQKAFVKKYAPEKFNENLTKKEASPIIDEIVSKWQKK